MSKHTLCRILADTNIHCPFCGVDAGAKTAVQGRHQRKTEVQSEDAIMGYHLSKGAFPTPRGHATLAFCFFERHGAQVMDVMESKYMLGVMCFATVWALFAVDLLILCGVAKSVRQLQSLRARQRLRPTDTTITGARVAQGDPVIYSISFIVFILFFTEWSVLSIFQNQPEDRQVNRRSGSICSQLV